MLPFKPIRAQAAALLLILPNPHYYGIRRGQAGVKRG
jgi:hypothetical protein